MLRCRRWEFYRKNEIYRDETYLAKYWLNRQYFVEIVIPLLEYIGCEYQLDEGADLHVTE